MKRIIDVWEDYGTKGIDYSSIILDYQKLDNRKKRFPEKINKAIKNSWSNSLEYSQRNNKSIFNKGLFNLLETDNLNSDYASTLAILGPIDFMTYNTTREFFNEVKNPKIYGLNKTDIDYMTSNIHPLSIFPAVIIEDKILMGKKGKQTLKVGSGKLSFPGAGYLDETKDTVVFDNHIHARKLDEIIFRELNEETKINPLNEIKNSRILGIAEDVYKGSHLSPGIMTVVETNISIPELKRRKRVAEDSWEHEGPYVFVPKDKEILEALIDSDIDHGNKPLPLSIHKEIKGLGPVNIHTTGKAGYMLFLIGRYLHGQKWYNDQLEKHKEHLRVA